MKDFDLFDETDDTMIDKLAQEFPVLTDEEKERIFAMSERKYNISDNTNIDFNAATEVSGVEVYKRPKWRTASIAASLAFLIGAGSFGGYNIAKQLHSGTENDNNAPTTVSDELSQASTETQEDPRTEEYRGVAEELLAGFDSLRDPIDYDNMPWFDEEYPDNYEDMTEEESLAYLEGREERQRQFDEENGQAYSDMWFELGIGDPYDHPNYTCLGRWVYDHYDVGMKFKDTDEVMSKALSIMSQSCIDKNFPHLIGDDLTNYEPDRIYRQDTEQCPDFGTYAMCNGKLYYNNQNYSTVNSNFTYSFYDRKDEPVEITDITDDSFTAVIKYDFTSVPNKYDMTMKVVKKDGNWIIDDLEPTGPELDQQKLDIIEKMCNSCDYFDNINAKEIRISQNEVQLEGENESQTVTNYSQWVYNTDNREAKEYSYSSIFSDYNGSLDPDSVLEFGKGLDVNNIQKDNESYCDGTTYYYWANPYHDAEQGIDWGGWAHYTYDVVPDKNNTEKYDPLTKVRLTEGKVFEQYYRDTRKMLCPNGMDLIYYLYELSKWDITGDITFDGRDCWVIEGSRPRAKEEIQMYPEDSYTDYKFYIDKETGIPMVVEQYDQNGKIRECNIYYDIKLNGDAEPVPEIDISSLDLTLTYK